jgi:hypothetical protein
MLDVQWDIGLLRGGCCEHALCPDISLSLKSHLCHHVTPVTTTTTTITTAAAATTNPRVSSATFMRRVRPTFPSTPNFSTATLRCLCSLLPRIGFLETVAMLSPPLASYLRPILFFLLWLTPPHLPPGHLLTVAYGDVW